MKSSVYWDITLCNLLKVSRRFGEAFRLHFQGRRLSRSRNQREAGRKQSLKSYILIKLVLYNAKFMRVKK